MVTSPGGYIFILLQDFTDAPEWPQRGVADGVGHAVIGPGPATFAPHKVIFPLPFEYKRAFHVPFGCDFFEYAAIFKRQEAGKITIQPGHIAIPPSSILQVILPLILEDKLVDGLGPVVELVDKELVQLTRSSDEKASRNTCSS